MKRLLLRLFHEISSVFKSHLIVYIENKLKLKFALKLGPKHNNKEGDVSNETNNTNN